MSFFIGYVQGEANRGSERLVGENKHWALAFSLAKCVVWTLRRERGPTQTKKKNNMFVIELGIYLPA